MIIPHFETPDDNDPTPSYEQYLKLKITRKTKKGKRGKNKGKTKTLTWIPSAVKTPITAHREGILAAINYVHQNKK